MDIKTLGIDLAKNIFQLHGVNAAGRLELKKTIRRPQLLEFIAKLPVCEIVMEACGGANYWARKFKEHGHVVKLISPQFVKPFVKGNKNDYKDAEAIVEASSRPSMRYVTPKTIEQQDMQSLLRSRQGCIQMRTSLSNQLRGLLGEYGIALSTGHAALRRALPGLFDRQQANELSIFFKELLESQYNMLLVIQQQIDEFDIKINELARTKEVCKRVQQVEGIGPITAVALAATIGDPHDFKNGRHFAAFVGLVPKQHSSGGKDRLLGISKRGDSYLRTLLIHGARAVLLRADKKSDYKSRWVTELKERRGSNRACVALANKNARTVLALLQKNEDYRKVA
jgi:transposase